MHYDFLDMTRQANFSNIHNHYILHVYCMANNVNIATVLKNFVKLEKYQATVVPKITSYTSDNLILESDRINVSTY